MVCGGRRRFQRKSRRKANNCFNAVSRPRLENSLILERFMG
jgi:hypothetical protein